MRLNGFRLNLLIVFGIQIHQQVGSSHTPPSSIGTNKIPYTATMPVPIVSDASHFGFEGAFRPGVMSALYRVREECAVRALVSLLERCSEHLFTRYVRTIEHDGVYGLVTFHS